jgi:hypothetical protein
MAGRKSRLIARIRVQDWETAVEENLLGHLLKANDPATAREVERRIADDPSTIHDLAHLRAALKPLESDLQELEPPADLWARTLARVAEHIVATEATQIDRDTMRTDELIRRAAAMTGAIRPASIAPAPPPPSEVLVTLPRRRNVFAVVALSAAVVALVLPAVVHVRRQAQQTACQDSMRQFYGAAAGYSDANDGRFPIVEDGKVAASAVESLKAAGFLPPDLRMACPAGPPVQPAPTALVNYAYSLGFRDDAGNLWGVERWPGNDMIPLLADAPYRQGTQTIPGNHRHGHNVLFAGGNVRFTTTSRIGENGDDIFCNANGDVGAGLYRLFPSDNSLGRPFEQP